MPIIASRIRTLPEPAAGDRPGGAQTAAVCQHLLGDTFEVPPGWLDEALAGRPAAPGRAAPSGRPARPGGDRR